MYIVRLLFYKRKIRLNFMKGRNINSRVFKKVSSSMCYTCHKYNFHNDEFVGCVD